MTQIIELSEDAFAALFKPQANQLNPNASFDWGDGFGTLYETFDEELEYVQQQPRNRIWTLISGDDGDYVTSGYHFVNRLGYFITEVALPEGVDIQVSMPETMDDTAFPELSPRLIQSLHAIVDYLWHDERKDYKASEISGRKSHIFRSVKIVHNWLNSSRSYPKARGVKP